MDAIDAALVDIDEQNARVLAYEQFPVAEHIQSQLRAINSTLSILLITELDVILGELFAEAVRKLINASGVKTDDIVAIGSHGQTILHLTEDNYPRTMQIGDANIIACKTGITTVADFRRMDIAAGGQGAPLASAFHAWLFRKQNSDRVVLNLGGMANITLLPGDTKQAVTGFDTGPGNALMDAWTQKHLNEQYDKNGNWAALGNHSEDLLQSLLQAPFFTATPPKSTGRDDFNLHWLEQVIDNHGNALTAADVQATLLALSIHSISQAINMYAPDTKEILVCGGGIHNGQLMQQLKTLLADQDIVSTAKYGVNPDALEAIVFAWLAKQRLDRKSGNLPSVTGARQSVILGAVYEPVKSEK